LSSKESDAVPLHLQLLVTRSSATAEKQHVSCTCLFRLANWSCSAQSTTVTDVVQLRYSQTVSAI